VFGDSDDMNGGGGKEDIGKFKVGRDFDAVDVYACVGADNIGGGCDDGEAYVWVYMLQSGEMGEGNVIGLVGLTILVK
jgi:hypothetical protein